MGIHRQVPDRLRQLHPRYGTPWIGILVFGGVACVAMLPGQADFLGNMYAFGAMLSFTIAHLAVIRLRFNRPTSSGPYRGPGNVRMGGDAPLFAVVGGLGTAAFVVVTVLHLDVASPASAGWRSARRLPALPPPPGARPHHDDEGGDPAAGRRPRGRVRLGARRARRRDYFAGGGRDGDQAGRAARRGIHVLVTITVPNSAADRRRAARAGAAAQAIIEQAKLQGGRRVSGTGRRSAPARPGG